MNAMDTGQKIFKKNVRTLTVTNPDNFMGVPVLKIGGHERLNINFDVIGDDNDYLRFRLLHCNADWQPSRLMESEYLGGFNEGIVEDYAFSSNTYVHYVNYNISLPDPSIPILRSGNYLIQIYPENDPDDIWLQARFSVTEEISYIEGGVTTRTDRGVNSEYQQLFLHLDFPELNKINPFQDIILTVTQNNRPETLRFIQHPMRVQGSTIIYEHTPELIFEAANEFRRFETVRADYPGMHVDSVRFVNGMWNAWLQTDESRRHRQYTYDSTQNGRFKIDEYNSTDPDLSADYILVHFTLDPESRVNGTIFVDGDLTNHVLDEESLMKYDWNDGLYHASIPLKQGSFNYQYTVVPEGEILPNPGPIEGNKYETVNEYLVMAYLRTPGSRGDRLIGYRQFR